MSSPLAFSTFAQLDAEWHQVATTQASRRQLRRWADTYPVLDGFGDLQEVVLACNDRSRVDEARCIQRVLLQLSDDTSAHRLLLQCLLPGIKAVTAYYWGLLEKWHRYSDLTEEVGHDVTAIAYSEIRRMAGRDLENPALAILDATRCRVRRLAIRGGRPNEFLPSDLVESFDVAASGSPGSSQMTKFEACFTTNDCGSEALTLTTILAEARDRGLLTPVAREVIFRTIVMGESVDSVAEHLGRSREAVKRLRTRARQQLIERADEFGLAS